MLLIFIYLLFVNVIDALVCPIYSRKDLIKTCDRNCLYQTIDDYPSACIGVYTNTSGEILIKQLGIISSDQQCLTLNECYLENDPLNLHTYSCCCSNDNCTLSWKTILSTTTTVPSIITPNQIHLEPNKNTNNFSWKLFLILILFIIILILITFIYHLWKYSRKTKNTNNQSLMVKSLSSSISIETLFYSAQQLMIGKNSIIYKSIWNQNLVVLKVYNQSNLLIWKNEVNLLKSIKHESIIKLLSDGQFNSYLYLIVPYYEHGTLQSYLRTSNRTLAVKQCLIYMRSLASAVAYLHTGKNSFHMSIVHRDIKSSNILIDNNDLNLYLADFGVAMFVPQILTEKDFVQIGTIRYMAPELLEGVITHTREALCSVDIYALALVLWEILRQCDVYPITVYQPPYEEYMTTNSDNSSFAAQLYDIVVVRKCRPSLNREIKDKQYSSIIEQLCLLIESCWTTDADIRMNAQTLTFKLNQLIDFPFCHDQMNF